MEKKKALTFIEDLEEGKKLAEKYGAEAFWIDHDDKEYRTDGYKNYEKQELRLLFFYKKG